MASRYFLSRLRTKGYNLRRVLIVGTGRLAEQVTKKIQSETWLGLRIVGYVGPDDEYPAENIEPHLIFGSLEQLKDVVHAEEIDHIIIALPTERLPHLPRIMDFLSLETVDVRMVPDFYHCMTLCGGIDELAGMPIINLQLSPLYGWNVIFKRIFDFVFALLAVALLFLN